MGGEPSARALNRAFRRRGLTLRGGAARAAAAFVARRGGGEEANEVLQRLVAAVKERGGLASAMVDEEAVVGAVAALGASSSASPGPDRPSSSSSPAGVAVVNAFTMPRLRYNGVRRSLDPVGGPAPALHGSAADKGAMFRERYELAFQRAERHLRHESGGAVRITRIKSLLGSPGVKTVFGMLTQITEGRWYLEDLNAHVPVDLSAAAAGGGLFTDGCMVLAQGELDADDGVFVASELHHPPPEPRHDTLKQFPKAAAAVAPPPAPAADAAEDAAMVVVLSDVHLDEPRVLGRLRALFAGLAHSRPLAFVLCGNFASRPLPPAEYTALFRPLAELVLAYPEISSGACQIVLVPGPTDPAAAGAAVPRHPLLPILVEPFTRRVRSARLASNPCRLHVAGREVVVFRDDLVHRVRRHCAVPPPPASEAATDELLVATIVGQAHLCPLPPLSRPVHWNYDHALRLVPLPDALVLADAVDQYEWRLGLGCHAYNPGSFATDYSFVVHTFGGEQGAADGCSGDVEFSRVDS